MSIYIKGMEMPTKGMVIAIYKLDGKFYASVHGTELCPLVPVPEHGRLIDADALPRYTGYALSADEVATAVENAPTIIPADKEVDNG